MDKIEALLQTLSHRVPVLKCRPMVEWWWSRPTPIPQGWWMPFGLTGTTLRYCTSNRVEATGLQHIIHLWSISLLYQYLMSNVFIFEGRRDLGLVAGSQAEVNASEGPQSWRKHLSTLQQQSCLVSTRLNQKLTWHSDSQELILCLTLTFILWL